MESVDKRVSRCDSCVYYDYDEWYGEYVCRADLDEDESVDFLQGSAGQCPLYRFYDEYKSVQKQN
ncbi:MAG: hypothetical protein E7618_01305 [Ruminococcaceae bacterium]|nr:hypothetical protein [Oscillospiraceae bacterium]